MNTFPRNKTAIISRLLQLIKQLFLCAIIVCFLLVFVTVMQTHTSQVKFTLHLCPTHTLWYHRGHFSQLTQLNVFLVVYHHQKRKKTKNGNVKCTTGNKHKLSRQIFTFCTHGKCYVLCFYPRPLTCVTCWLSKLYVCHYIGLYSISKVKIGLHLLTCDYWVNFIFNIAPNE